MRVLFITFIPSPYRLLFFEELAKHCNLTVLFERNRSKLRETAWDKFDFKGYEGILLNGFPKNSNERLCLDVFKFLKRDIYDIIVLSNPLSATEILASQILRLKKIPYVIENDGAFPTGKKGIKQWIKRLVYRNAAYCLSTAKLNDEYLIEAGVNPDKIHRYPFTSVKSDDIISTPPSPEEKLALREMLRLKRENIVISVGRFIHSKGYDILFKTASVTPKVNYYIIGGKPPQQYTDMVRDLGLSNVYFLDFMPKDKVFEYLKASDIFVLPTRSDVWGLVVNEAMACGLPVVSTDMCIAATEMVENGQNGFIVESEDYKGIANSITDIFSSDLERMSDNALQTARKYTIETMTQTHIDFFQTIVNGK